MRSGKVNKGIKPKVPDETKAKTIPLKLFIYEYYSFACKGTICCGNKKDTLCRVPLF